MSTQCDVVYHAEQLPIPSQLPRVLQSMHAHLFPCVQMMRKTHLSSSTHASLTPHLQAGVYGIRLILAIGNLWPEYVGPEVFLSAAGESGECGCGWWGGLHGSCKPCCVICI
jgi:hypothetical protein